MVVRHASWVHWTQCFTNTNMELINRCAKCAMLRCLNHGMPSSLEVQRPCREPGVRRGAKLGAEQYNVLGASIYRRSFLTRTLWITLEFQSREDILATRTQHGHTRTILHQVILSIHKALCSKAKSEYCTLCQTLLAIRLLRVTTPFQFRSS